MSGAQPPRITASGLARVQACPASVALPVVLNTSEAAERGTAIHTFAERILSGWDRAVALAGVPEEWRETCAGFEPLAAVADLRRANRLVEASYCLNAIDNTATFLGSGLSRQYPAAALGDIHGTTDVEGINAWHGRPVIVDWKSGSQDVASPQDNLQLRFAARAVALLRGASEVEARVVAIRNSGRADIDAYVFSTFALDDIGDELEELYRRALAISESSDRGMALLPVLRPGKHCRYCPALPACPAQVSLARALLPNLQATQATLGAMTPEERGAAFMKYREARALMEILHEAFNALARVEPIPVDDEKEVREITFLKRAFNRQAALAMLRDKGATEGEIASLDQQVRQARIDVYKRPGLVKKRKGPSFGNA